MSETANNPAQTGNTGTVELQHIQPSLRLNGRNYLKWSHFVQTFLKGKGKLNHLTGKDAPKPTDSNFGAWDEADAVVMSWLWNSMVPEVSDACMFMKTAKDVWESCKQNYSKVGDAAQIYEIKMKIATTKQGDRSVNEYAQNLQNLWLELDHYEQFEAKCTEDAALLKRYKEKDRIYKFLTGLNNEFDPVRIQVLGKELSSLNETMAAFRAEEARRGVMMEPQSTESSALAAQSKGKWQTSQSGGVAPNMEIDKGENKDSLWCTFCKKPRHTQDRCWKLHGKPPNQNRNWTTKGTQRGGPAQAHLAQSSVAEGSPSRPLTDFNTEEIKKLRDFLETLVKPTDTGSSSLAFSGNSQAYALSVLQSTAQGTWVVDSGATDHMTYSSTEFISYRPCPSNKKIATADGTFITVAGKGDILLSQDLILRDVLHVPKLSAKLLSVHKLTTDLQCLVTFSPTLCKFQDQGKGKMIGLAREENGLYLLKEARGTGSTKSQLPLSLLSESLSSHNKEIWLCHFRLGHPSFSTLKIMFPSLFQGLDIGMFHCDDCEFAKHKRVSFPISNKRTSVPFSLVHSDVWGPSNIPNISGARWFVIFIDDCTRVSWVYLLKQKSEVSQTFQNFFQMIRNQFGTAIKRFRSDNAKDYFNQTLSSFFNTHGIIHESSCVHTPQQNGVTERKIGHLLAITRASLFHTNVPKQYWGEAILTAAYLINRLPSQTLQNSSPIQLFSKFYPHFKTSNNLVPRIFGCVSFVHVHSPHRGKLDPRAIKCIFVGYSPTQKGYKCYHPTTKKVFVSIDVTFVETESFFSQPYLQGENSCMEDKDDLFTNLSLISPKESNILESNPIHIPSSLESSPIHTPPDMSLETTRTPNPSAARPLQVYTRRTAPIIQPVQAPNSELIPETETNETVLEEQNIPIDAGDFPIAKRKGVRTCTQRPRYPLSHFMSYDKLSNNHRSFLTHLSTITIPKTANEALDSKEWREAMKVEMDALEKNETWDLVELPKEKKLVGCKWVFTVKYKADGTLERYKARLVAKGYTQTYGIDYLETFSPVAKMNTVRILLSLAANYGWSLQQFDVKNAFLHGTLEEEIYMEVPPGFNFEKGKVCKLRKALYGLKQSPRAWFGRFATVMKAMGYKQSQGDHTLFIKHSTSGGVIALIVYVDDIVVTGNDQAEMDILKGCLVREFEIKELGRLKYFLGLEVAHSRHGIFISQQKYVLDLLSETGKLGCKPVETPIEQNHRLSEFVEDVTVDRESYQKLVGKLIYLSHTRPDIAYAVGVVSQFMHNPKENHLRAVYRILQYLKGTPGKGILFTKGEEMTLEAYTDADYAGSVDDRRSTSGYCTFLGGNLVTWRSKKQNVVARSSAEAEFRAMALGICELLWLKIILDDLKIKWNGPMKLYCDNKSAINIAHNPVQHDRTKHVEVDRHFIKEKLDNGTICTPFVSTGNQLADVLTKGLSGSTFQAVIGKLGMDNIHSPT